MTHDPICPVVKGCVCGEPDDYLCCQCDLIAEVRDSERFSTVEGAVVIASQSGARPGSRLAGRYDHPRPAGYTLGRFQPTLCGTIPYLSIRMGWFRRLT